MGYNKFKARMIIEAEKKEMVMERGAAPPEIIYLGKVGYVVQINTGFIDALLKRGFISVIVLVGEEGAGEIYNINADSVAWAVAATMKTNCLCLLTDGPGLLDKSRVLVSSLSVRRASAGE